MPSDRSDRDPRTDPVARRRAVALAGHAGDVPSIRAALQDPDAGVRGAALGALVRTGAVEAGDVRAALTDSDPALRRRAAEEAARSGLTAVVPDVVALVDDDDVATTEAAVFALGELGLATTEVVAALVGASTHHDVLVREAAVAALGSLAAPEGLDAVLRASTDVATVRRRAVLALAAFDGPDVEAALARLTEDRDRQVRQAAEDLVHGWGTANDDADDEAP